VIFGVIWRRLFWKTIAELLVLEFAVNFIDSYDEAKQEARRRHARR